MIRVIKEGQRGCGKRKKGSIYLVGEGSPDGILPMFVAIDPPIPYEGDHFRGTVLIDLDAVLGGLPQGEWLVGASERRARRQSLKAEEIDLFGMTMKEREALGIPTLSLELFGAIAHSLRALAKMKLGKSQVEIPKAFKAIQDNDPQQVLACLWRLWKGCSSKRKIEARLHVRLAMYNLGAVGDSLEVAKKS